MSKIPRNTKSEARTDVNDLFRILLSKAIRISINLLLRRCYSYAPSQNVMLNVFAFNTAGSNVEDGSKNGRNRCETMALRREGETQSLLLKPSRLDVSL